MMQYRGYYIIVIAFLSVFASCAHYEIASDEELDIAKSFQPPSNSSFIYIIANKSGVFSTFESVNLDNEAPVEIPLKAFTLFEVAPGRHRITAWANKLERNPDAIRLDCQPGSIYFIEVKRGIAKCTMKILSENDGKDYVLKYKMISTGNIRQKL